MKMVGMPDPKITNRDHKNKSINYQEYIDHGQLELISNVHFTFYSI